MVKSSGPVAAVYAMDANPALPLLLLVFAWAFCWEIGGQNVPSDWNDTVEDKRVNAKTIPLQLGTEKAGYIVLFMLSLTVTLSLFLPRVFAPLPGLDVPSRERSGRCLASAETGIQTV